MQENLGEAQEIISQLEEKLRDLSKEPRRNEMQTTIRREHSVSSMNDLDGIEYFEESAPDSVPDSAEVTSNSNFSTAVTEKEPLPKNQSSQDHADRYLLVNEVLR